jgi:hypothetical protein
MTTRGFRTGDIPAFDRRFFASEAGISLIGSGGIGGKARGLVQARDILERTFGSDAGLAVGVPVMAVIGSDVFDAFLDRNGLRGLALSDLPDERIAHAFQDADLPVEILGDLRAIVEEVRVPLAVRSSSRLEDALFRPFAGVFETKMTPNNQPEPGTRFQRLAESVKFVFASTFFRAARSYIRATRESLENEKMSVIIQEVVGNRYNDRYYPNLSGVGRSFNYYPQGGARREEGVVDLALGLGKTIVDGGTTYAYSPARPKAPPPYASTRDWMRLSQSTFWAVNMGRAPAFDPIAEAEYLVEAGLDAADYDGTLTHVASTYIPESDRISPGVGHRGPRVLDFAPLLSLDAFPVNRTVRRLLEVFARELETAVEIEFACTFPGGGKTDRARFGFLQVRPMVVTEGIVDIAPEEMEGPHVLLASDRVLGNGTVDTIRDVVYVKRGTFETRHTRGIATELEGLNEPLFRAGRPYLLIGFGRWGSIDPWLGIPVQWGQICGAKAIVETSLPQMRVDPSQGSHFFQNLSSFEVSYFTVGRETGIRWERLDALPAEAETGFVRHVRLPGPLLVKVDGRSGRGLILTPPEAA